MKKMRIWALCLLVFVLTFLFFYQVQYASTGIPGFDGYYHIKLAQIIGEKGLIRDFPWLKFTFETGRFVDHHFLFHLLLIPFTYFWNLMDSAKIAAVCFAAMMGTLFFLVIFQSGIKGSLLWVALLLASSTPFLYRMSLPRVGPLSLCFLFISFLFLREQRHVLLGLTAFFFVWLYGGFTVLMALGLAWTVADLSLNGKFSLKGLLSITLGISAGLIINPYFPQNISFVYLQTMDAGLARNIPGGTEWKPYDTWYFLKSSAPVFPVVLSSIYVLAISGKRLRTDSLTMLLMSFLFCALYIRSRRFVEYWVPFSLLASAFVLRDTWQNTQLAKIIKRQSLKIISSGLLIFAILALLGYRYSQAKDSVGQDPREPERYRGAAQWLSQNTPESLVYTSDWDYFPELFFYNSQNKYLIGLDPAFMYKRDKLLYDKWIALNRGMAQDDPYELFLNDFQTVYLFTDYNHSDFIALVEKTPGIALAYSDRFARIYRLLPRE
ncbi:MAG: hypothetical protein HY730_03680 [Candidatus Tectomicrobia bacterium]|uniref:Uncharacterized protein n=1 Tax=Tectimicrobiota bacterium TaxID=2528274 RepID=A0A933GKD7_UNCTE|nr:hypothetical protein [Candidatus Tectomicrobia bacterium]